MRIVVQRVSRAGVSVAGALKSSIGSGLLVLLGVARDDGPDDARYIAGEFGAMMDVELLNDGPVTIILDSRPEQVR